MYDSSGSTEMVMAEVRLFREPATRSTDAVSTQALAFHPTPMADAAPDKSMHVEPVPGPPASRLEA